MRKRGKSNPYLGDAVQSAAARKKQEREKERQQKFGYPAPPRRNPSLRKAKDDILTAPVPDAFLWDVPAAAGRVVIYARAGQHSEGDIDYYHNDTVPAKLSDPEVQALKRELEDIGYVLHVVRKRPSGGTPASFGPNDVRVSFRYPKQSVMDRRWGKSKNPDDPSRISRMMNPRNY